MGASVSPHACKLWLGGEKQRSRSSRTPNGGVVGCIAHDRCPADCCSRLGVWRECGVESTIRVNVATVGAVVREVPSVKSAVVFVFGGLGLLRKGGTSSGTG